MADLRIAILDSDSGFVRVLVKRAADLGWQYRCLEAAPPVEEFVAMRVNALVVDLSLMGPRAWEFLERVTAALPGMGVVVCTGRTSVSQRVRGLRAGADDWITKPCHPEEVLARIEAVVRRRKRASARVETGPLVAGELEIRADQFQAFVRGRSVDLTRREFELLQLLAQAQGKVLQREEIYQAVWGYAMAHGDRSVDVFVRKVRLKLETASPDWSYIHTHFGVGYRFQPERPGGAGRGRGVRGGAAQPAGIRLGAHREHPQQAVVGVSHTAAACRGISGSGCSQPPRWWSSWPSWSRSRVAVEATTTRPRRPRRSPPRADRHGDHVHVDHGPAAGGQQDRHQGRQARRRACRTSR